MTNQSINRKRILKVEEVGDFYRGRTTPRIRLKGKWLTIAGILPNGYIQVENPKPQKRHLWRYESSRPRARIVRRD